MIAKGRAEIQKAYRARKKAAEGADYLKKNYTLIYIIFV